jgi:hypothetical protein
MELWKNISIIKCKVSKKTCSIRIQNLKGNEEDNTDLNAPHIMKLLILLFL